MASYSMKFAAAAVMLLVGPASDGSLQRALIAERWQEELGPILTDGDVLFRVGTGLEADAVRALDQRSRLSHVGLVVGMPQGWAVVHADPEAGVVAEPLNVFLSPTKATGYALYRRPGATTHRLRIRNDALAMVRRHIPFDRHFDFSNDSALYCTELVWRELTHEESSEIPIILSVKIAMLNIEVMTPSDLIISLDLQLVEDAIWVDR